MTEQKYQYLETVLAETGTTRDDWIFGTAAIGATVGMSAQNIGKNADVKDTIRRIHADGSSYDYIYIMLKNDAIAVHKKLFPPANGNKPIVTPEQQELNRLALLEHAVEDNTAMLKNLSHHVYRMEEKLDKLLKDLS